MAILFTLDDQWRSRLPSVIPLQAHPPLADGGVGHTFRSQSLEGSDDIFDADLEYGLPIFSLASASRAI